MSNTKALEEVVDNNIRGCRALYPLGGANNIRADQAAAELAELKADMSAMATLGMKHQMEREQLRSQLADKECELDEARKFIDFIVAHSSIDGEYAIIGGVETKDPKIISFLLSAHPKDGER
jgi:hypothetical protein